MPTSMERTDDPAGRFRAKEEDANRLEGDVRGRTTAAMDWTPAAIEDRTVRLLGKQGPFRPTVRLLDLDGHLLVAKDYRACTALYRWSVGAWNLRRERSALARLEGLEGVP